MPVPPSSAGRVCPPGEEWRASKAPACAASGRVEPDGLRSLPAGTRHRCCQRAASPSHDVTLPLQASREPTRAASSLERDFLLLTCPIAGATRFVIASPSGRSGDDRSRRSHLAQNAQAVCARSDGRIGRMKFALNREMLVDCDKTVRTADLLWMGRGKLGQTVNGLCSGWIQAGVVHRIRRNRSAMRRANDSA